MASKIQLRTMTPDRILLDEPVDIVIFRTEQGDMGVMAGHEPMVATLAPCEMMIRRDSEESVYMVSGGFAMIDRDKVVVLSEIAESPDRMEALLEKMEQARRKRAADNQIWESDVTRAEMAIRRMLMGKNELSAYSILKGKGEEGEAL